MCDQIISLFKGASLSAQQQEFNSRMSSVREAVEWTFGIMKAMCAFVDFKKKHKIMLSPVGKVVHTAMLITNCHSCYFGGN